MPDRSGWLGFNSPSLALSRWPTNILCPLGIGFCRWTVNNEWKGGHYENRARWNRPTHCRRQFAGEHNLGHRDKHVVWSGPVRQSTQPLMKCSQTACTGSSVHAVRRWADQLAVEVPNSCFSILQSRRWGHNGAIRTLEPRLISEEGQSSSGRLA